MKRTSSKNREEASDNIGDYVGAVEAADIIGINYRTFISLDERQEFTKKQFGRRIYYLRDDLLRYVKTQEDECIKELKMSESPKISFEEFEARFKYESKRCKSHLKEEVYRFFKDFKRRDINDKNSLMNTLHAVFVDRKASNSHISVADSDVNIIAYWYRYVMEVIGKGEYRFKQNSICSLSDNNGECCQYETTIVNNENIENILFFEIDDIKFSQVFVDFLEFLLSNTDQDIIKLSYQRSREKIRALGVSSIELAEIVRMTPDDKEIKNTIDMLWLVFRDGALPKKYHQ